jgi:hypothetical protein
MTTHSSVHFEFHNEHKKAAFREDCQEVTVEIRKPSVEKRKLNDE